MPLAVISYDIPDDRRRAKVARTLLDYATRVQYSVFECRKGEAILKRLLGELRRIADLEKDSIRCYRLCAACATKVETIGRGPVREDDYVVV